MALQAGGEAEWSQYVFTGQPSLQGPPAVQSTHLCSVSSQMIDVTRPPHCALLWQLSPFAAGIMHVDVPVVSSATQIAPPAQVVNGLEMEQGCPA
jgi:hypothetical protein